MALRKTLTEELMKEKRLKILKYLLENPDREFILKEVADGTETSYKTVKTMVDLLEGYGFIETEKKGNYRLVTVNQDSPYVEAFERLGELDAKPFRDTAEEFAETLEERYPEEISSIVLFGSVVRGMPVSGSDIDILVLVEDEELKEDVEDEAWSLADKYEREEGMDLSPLVFTRKKFEREARNNGPLENRIIEEGEALVGEILGGE